MGPWLSWLERLHGMQKVVGSNPIGSTGELAEWLLRSPRKRVGEIPYRFESCTLRSMQAIINFLNNNILIIAGLVLILIAWSVFLYIQNLRIRKKIKIFLKGRKVKDLEEVISEQLKRMKRTETDVKKLFKWNKDLQKICDISIQKVGVVRFNPFRDTGGDQSFVIALLDSQNNGLVLSSLYTREGTRVYTKPIEIGTSKYHLTKEEERAIKEAISS